MRQTKMTKKPEHHHLFDPKNIAMLETKERKNHQNPEKIINLINPKQSDVVADLGSGSGYFTLPLSQKVKKVYAIDIQKEMLDYLQNKVQNQQITNIELLLSNDPNKIPLLDQSSDVLLTVNTLHEFPKKQEMINEIYRVLKPNGKATIIDFKKEKTSYGPPLSIRVSQEQAIKLFENTGFKTVKTHDLKSNYMLIFQK